MAKVLPDLISPQLVQRYRDVRQRIDLHLKPLRLRAGRDPSAPGGAILAAEISAILRDTRRTVSREPFGQAVPLPEQVGDNPSRKTLLLLLEEADLALLLFRARYYLAHGPDDGMWLADDEADELGPER